MLLHCDLKIWTKLLVLNSTCKTNYVPLYSDELGPLGIALSSPAMAVIGECENCHILAGKCTYKTPLEAWNSANPKLACGFFSGCSFRRQGLAALL